MVQASDKLEVQREYTIQLLDQLTSEYLVLKSEMKQLSGQYPGSDDEFTFLEEFELLIVSICGYAKQIQATGSVKHLDSAIAHLQHLQVFANPTIAQFSSETSGRYPKVQTYLQMLDYLRLLTLEYLQMQHMQPVSV